MEEKITAYAKELGFTIDDIDLIRNHTQNGDPLKGWKIIKYFPGQEKEIKELEKFIVNLEYNKEINNFKQVPQVVCNQVNI